MIDPKYTDFVNFIRTRKNHLLSPMIAFYLKHFAGVIIGKNAKFSGWPIVFCRQGGRIIIGNDFKATSESVSNTVGIPHPVILSSFGNHAKLIIGNNVGLSGVSINCWNSIQIGDNVMVGGGAAIWDTDFHPIDPEIRLEKPWAALSKPIIIEQNVFIGARAMILKGVKIGQNSVIGACTVVNKSVPKNSLVFGNPMIIKNLKK